MFKKDPFKKTMKAISRRQVQQSLELIKAHPEDMLKKSSSDHWIWEDRPFKLALVRYANGRPTWRPVLDALRELDPEGKTLCKHTLTYLCRSSNIPALEYLKEHNLFDVNMQLNDGNTPLHIAAENEQTGLIRWLFEHGADAQMKNAQGVYPADMTTTPAQYDLFKKNDAVPAPGDDVDIWEVLSPTTIAHTAGYAGIALQLTDIFNFETRERVALHVIDGKQKITHPPQPFSTIDPETLNTAAQHFEKIAGQKPPNTEAGFSTYRKPALNLIPQNRRGQT
ncbi:MAG: ankyrin repeat domain-containing protein [Alphaproteobacteria bacterium]|nr:ankyrin repeat domain-containing protein [Alphaproteobacteria bacterium]